MFETGRKADGTGLKPEINRTENGRKPVGNRSETGRNSGGFMAERGRKPDTKIQRNPFRKRTETGREKKRKPGRETVDPNEALKVWNRGK